MARPGQRPAQRPIWRRHDRRCLGGHRSHPPEHPQKTSSQAQTKKQERRMKLLFDARYIRTDFHDGISRYTTELGNALARATAVTFIISDKAQLKFLPENAEFVMLHPVTSWR